MGELRQLEHEEAWLLTREELIGRSRRCDRILSDANVSSQHATIRWTGQAWELRDLGSRNGTFVQGRRLTSGEHALLLPETHIRFGSGSAEWVLVDASPPATIAIRLGDGHRVVESNGIISLPSEHDPHLFLLLDGTGRWVCEAPDGDDMRPVEDDATLLVDGEPWRFRAATPDTRTRHDSNAAPTLGAVALHFSVSSDEEHVLLVADVGGELRRLEARAHHYLLLTLARERLVDTSKAPDSPESHGWILQDTACRMLKKSVTHLNVEIHRARRQFSELGLCDAANIIERRQDTKELRIGCSKLKVERLHAR